MTAMDLRAQIRARIKTAELPRGHPQRLWAGSGTGQTCAACDRSIPTTSVEIEAHGADDKYRYYHADCYSIVVEERFALAAEQPDTPRW